MKKLILCCLLLSGCSFFSSETRLELALKAATPVNLDIAKKSSPIEVDLFQLTAAYPFNQLSYLALHDDPTTHLGSTLQDRQRWVLQPGTKTSWKINLATETRYLGVVAGYRQLAHRRWKQLIPVQAQKKNVVNLKLGLKGIISHA